MNFDIEKRIKILKEFADKKRIKLFISLSSSAENSNKAFFGGVRITDFFVIVSFINVSQKNLDQIYQIIDKYSDKVFIDVEKKHPFYLKEFNSLDEDEVLYSNLLGAAYQKFQYEKIVPWAPSRLTAESTLSLLRNLNKGIISGLKVSLIGVGSIGLKVALYLVEEGCSVVIFNRDKSKSQNIADIINRTKSEYTIANASFSYNHSTTMASSSTLILAANDNNYISRNDLRLMPGSKKLIIDISKNSLSNEAKTYVKSLSEQIIYQRVDIGEKLVKLAISEYFNEQSNQFSKASCKSVIRNNKNIRIVSGGFPGGPRDYVVDSVINPSFILGEIDEKGTCRNTFESF